MWIMALNLRWHAPNVKPLLVSPASLGFHHTKALILGVMYTFIGTNSPSSRWCTTCVGDIIAQQASSRQRGQGACPGQADSCIQ